MFDVVLHAHYHNEMTIEHSLITYNGMGRHKLSMDASAFLLQGSPRSFGSAISNFELYAHVKTRSRALPTLGGMKEEFRARLRTLPKIWFVRRYARVDISYASNLGEEEDLARKRTGAESLELFSAACQEIVRVLQLAKARLKKTDNFDWEGFVAHLNRQLQKIPTTARALT